MINKKDSRPFVQKLENEEVAWRYKVSTCYAETIMTEEQYHSTNPRYMAVDTTIVNSVSLSSKNKYQHFSSEEVADILFEKYKDPVALLEFSKLTDTKQFENIDDFKHAFKLNLSITPKVIELLVNSII